MNIFISLKLTQRLGVWFDLDFTQWKIEYNNYCTFSEGQCLAVRLGPLAVGCNYPNAAGEAEQHAQFDAAMKQLNKAKEAYRDQE